MLLLEEFVCLASSRVLGQATVLHWLVDSGVIVHLDLLVHEMLHEMLGASVEEIQSAPSQLAVEGSSLLEIPEGRLVDLYRASTG